MATVKKVKKAQDGWIERAACSRGICGKGSVSDRRAARMDRREERRARREERKEDRQIRREERRASGGGLGRLFGKKDEYKKGGTVKKAQTGLKKPLMEKKSTMDKKMLEMKKNIDNPGRRRSMRMAKSGTKITKSSKKK